MFRSSQDRLLRPFKIRGLIYLERVLKHDATKGSREKGFFTSEQPRQNGVAVSLFRLLVARIGFRVFIRRLVDARPVEHQRVSRARGVAPAIFNGVICTEEFEERAEMGASRKSRIGSFAGSVVLLLVSSLLALVLAESIFRAYKQIGWQRAAKYHQHVLYLMVPDSPLEYVLRPSVNRVNEVSKSGIKWSYQLNADGFRGDEFDLQSNKKRVLFVGDSYTFGWGVDQQEVLPYRLERLLAGPPYAMDVEIYNLGVPGYNTLQESHLLSQVIDRYSPELVMLGYVMNDAQPQANVHERPSVRYRYVRSWLLAFIKEQYNYYIHEGEAVLATGLNLPDKDFVASVVENQPKWVATRQALTDMAALARSRDIPFILVVFPSFNMHLDRRYPFRPIHDEVNAWSAEAGVKSVDLLDYLQSIDREAYRVPGDGHPNGKAFEAAAGVLAPVIYGALKASSPSRFSTE